MARLEAERKSSRIYFTEHPEPETIQAPDVNVLEDIIDDRFGYEVQDEEWNGISVYTVDCTPKELPSVTELVEEAGFMTILRYRQRTTARKLLASGITVLPLAELAKRT